MNETSEITLLRESIVNNIQYVHSQISPKTELCSVVKGNAYGHGIETFVPMMLAGGVKAFAVYSTDEAMRVKAILPPGCRLIVMGDADELAINWLIEEDVEFYVFTFHRLKNAVKASIELGKKARVHIELETGMYRTGFDESDLPELAEIMSSSREYIHFAGLCTHFAGAELLENLDRVNTQAEKFKSGLQYFREQKLYPQIVHACCSAAMMRMPKMHFDLVRVGIMLYGFWPSREMSIEYAALHPEKPNPLKRVIRWKSRIMSIKDVPAGAWVGYGETFAARTNMKIAVVPVGYAHGYARSLSNYGQVLVKGIKLPVLGVVNMNCMSIDVTLIKDLEINDEVVLIGNQKDEELSVASFSERSEQLNYELLTRLPHSIPRKED
ncbi:MAG: alanine racemase [Bacteroidia bacterium]